jgi:nucleotide-binding universal stress UspA family protein
MTLPLTQRTLSAHHDLARADAVVAGFDGSWHSRPAVDRAADEALQRGLQLRLLSLVTTDVDPALSSRAQVMAEQQRLALAHRLADDVAEQVRASRPGLVVTVDVVTVPDEDAVREHLATCRLLVVGDRGGHGGRAFLLGTSSRELVRAITCPVLVVPDDWLTQQPSAQGGVAQSVLVGVGTGPETPATLRVAAVEALRTGSHLLVLHSYAGVAGATPDERLERARAEVELRLREAAIDPAVHVTTVFTPDPPADALLLHATRTRLLVIGSRGPIALARLSIGSVSRRVLDDAVAPVMIVP